VVGWRRQPNQQQSRSERGGGEGGGADGSADGGARGMHEHVHWHEHGHGHAHAHAFITLAPDHARARSPPPQRVPLAFASYWSRKFSKQSEKVKKDVTSQPSWSRIRNFSTSALLGASSSDHISSGLSFDVTQYVLMECLNADLERLLRKSTLLFTEICTPQHIGKLT
jgi:hypothetical protein